MVFCIIGLKTQSDKKLNFQNHSRRVKIWTYINPEFFRNKNGSLLFQNWSLCSRYFYRFCLARCSVFVRRYPHLLGFWFCMYTKASLYFKNWTLNRLRKVQINQKSNFGKSPRKIQIATPKIEMTQGKERF